MSNPIRTNRDGLLVSLDVGSTKVTVLIAQAKPEGLEIVGVGNAEHQAVKQGTIVHIEAATDAIRKAKDEAELMAGVKVDKAFMSVSGSQCKSVSSKGMVAILNKEVCGEDVKRVVEAAKVLRLSTDQEILHVLPREFSVDQEVGIKNPVGMNGVRLEAQVEIVTANSTGLLNLRKCAEGAGIKPLGFYLQALASAKAVLTPEECEAGVAMIDLGGGTSDVVCFFESSFFFMSSIPVGGINFTQDVAVGLRTPQAVAEDIKCKHGSAIADLIEENETIDVEGIGGRGTKQILRKFLGEILEARAEETLSLIFKTLSAGGVIEKAGAGLVLTGGGAQLYGLLELGEYTFDIPVRRGMPENVEGLKEAVKSPIYSTAVGVLLLAFDENMKKHFQNKNDSMSWVFDRWGQLKDFVGKSLN